MLINGMESERFM